MEPLPSLLSGLRSVDPGNLDQEYNVVRSQSLVLKRDLSLTTEAGALKDNIKKNRYKDILPYDQSRVLLSLPTSDSDCDYINASFIKGATGVSRYIASQGPLSSTVIDFWRMIWQHDVKVIVMACREVEKGKKKCECYWAPVNHSVTFGPFTVWNRGEAQPSRDIVVRTLAATYLQSSRTVTQFQFLSWPDHDIPDEASGVLDLLDRARSSQDKHTTPMLIHCSAGCGRTGVICALDYIHDLLVTKQITADFSIMKLVLQLRTQRPSAVQTKEQYQFLFSAVACMFERALQPAQPQLYCNMPEQLKKQEKSTTSASPTKRSPRPADMNDTYAVVNKPRHSVPSPGPPAALPRQSRSLTSPHQYDNISVGLSAAPLYSAVKPRSKPHSLKVVPAAIYDNAVASSPTGPGAPSPDSRDYKLVSAQHHRSLTDEDYEDVSEQTSISAPGGIGFNCRIQKPRGPREPPAEWSRLER